MPVTLCGPPFPQVARDRKGQRYRFNRPTGIVWHLLADPTARFHDLGAGFYDTRINPERAKRNHVRQLEALGYKVTLEPAA
jgi:hypothetical protein